MEKRQYVRSKPSPLAADYERNQKAHDRKKKDLQRLEELEDLMMETPFNDPSFQKYVEERNNLLIKI